MDFTYVHAWTGFVHVALIVDVFAQRIVAWNAETAKDTDLVMAPLRMAILQRHRDGPPIVTGELIGHADALFPDGDAPAVVLARSDLFPDAQVGAPLAVDLGSPLLLSSPEALTAATEEEIVRILPAAGTVVLLGGKVALSDAVADGLVELGYDVVRYGGDNRFETAVRVAEDGLSTPPVVLLADGGDFASAVVAGSAGVVAGGADGVAAVLLTSGAEVPPATGAYLEANDPELFAVGAGAAEAAPAAEALVGANSFATSVVVADRFFDRPSLAGVATGMDFPDALAAGALLGLLPGGPGPLLLSQPDVLPQEVSGYIEGNAETLSLVVLIGGERALSADVDAAVRAALGQ